MPERRTLAMVAAVLIVAALTVWPCIGGAKAEPSQPLGNQAGTDTAPSGPEGVLEAYRSATAMYEEDIKASNESIRKSREDQARTEANLKAIEQTSLAPDPFDPTGEVLAGAQAAARARMEEDARERALRAQEQQTREQLQELAAATPSLNPSTNAPSTEQRETRNRALGIVAFVIAIAGLAATGISLTRPTLSKYRAIWPAGVALVALMAFVFPPRENVWGSPAFRGWGPIWELGYDPDKQSNLRIAFLYLWSEWAILAALSVGVVALWRGLGSNASERAATGQ